MRFYIKKNDLLKFLQPLTAIIPVKNTMPILINYKIEANTENNTLTFTATDLDIYLKVEIDAHVLEDGVVLTPAREFNEIVNVMPDNDINFQYIDGDFKIYSGDVNFNLHVAELELYPIIPEFDLSSANEIQSQKFKKMVNSTSFAVGKDINRPIFQGILWRITRDSHLMASSDGKRFTEIVYENTNNLEKDMEFVVPPKGFDMIAKAIDDSPEKVLKYQFNQNSIVVSYDRYFLLSNVLEGKFPKYETIFNPNYDNFLVLNTKELQLGIKRTSLLAKDEYSKIKFDVDANYVKLFAEDRDTGEALETIKVVDFKSDPISISYNYHYLQSVLNVIETENVKILLGDGEGPSIVYNSDDFEEYKARFLLMPVII